MSSERVKRIMSAVFERDVSDISDNAQADDLPEWTSLAHLTLLLSIESEFGIVLDEHDFVDLISLPRIVARIERQSAD